MAQTLTKRIAEAANEPGYIWDREVKGFGLVVTESGTKSFILNYRNICLFYKQSIVVVVFIFSQNML